MKNKIYISLFCIFSVNFLNAFSEKEFVVITPTSKNLSSILNQDYTNFKVIYLASNFDTNEFAALQQHSNFDRLQVRAIQDNKIGFEGMLWHEVHQLSDDTIVFVLEEQDVFTCSSALHELNQCYQGNCTWMTCGFWQDFAGTKSLPQEVYTILSQPNGRNYRLSVQQPKTFYAWLFKQIKLQDLLLNNNFFQRAFSNAYIYPMLEMAKEHIVCFDKKVVASDSQELTEDVINECELIAQLSPYEPLPATKKTSCKKEQADLVVFSFDRPLQLYAFLESVERYVQGLSSILVVYRTSNKEMKKGYKELQKCFASVIFIEQSSKRPQADFKQKTFEAFNVCHSNYIAFAVDDIIVKDYINIAECTHFLQKTQAHGFYLRLGKNITYCYMNKRNQEVPDLLPFEEGFYAWCFRGAECDWCSPNTVDMTIYAKNKVLPILEKLNFDSPNYLEGAWAGSANLHNDLDKIGLCFEESKIINIPLNQVQNHSGIRLSMNISIQELLKKFKSHYKIDINQFYKTDNNSPHMEYVPTFVKR